MTLVNSVRAALLESAVSQEIDLGGALAEAERLSDLYADIQPQPYVVPIGRYVGCHYVTQLNHETQKDKDQAEFTVALNRVAVGLSRGGSVRLNRFEPFPKWISRSVMPRPGLVATG